MALHDLGQPRQGERTDFRWAIATAIRWDLSTGSRSEIRTGFDWDSCLAMSMASRWD